MVVNDMHADVALVTMPFAPVTQPSLALSLLQGMLEPGRSRIHYETIRFAERIGVELYTKVVDGSPSTTSLVGEWLFRAAAFGDDPARDDAYVQRFLGSTGGRLVRTDRDTTVDAAYRDELLDARAIVDDYLDTAVARVLADNPRIVGFTSVFQQHVASVALARRVKAAAPDTTIVFGGANCEGPMARALLRNVEAVDLVVSGEGEVPFRTIVDDLTSSGRVRPGLSGVLRRSDVGPLALAGASITGGEALPMDELPVPDYGDFFEQWRSSTLADEQTPYLLFESARGCWWGERRHCTFCGLNGDRMAFRAKSPDRAVDEFRSLVQDRPGLPIYAVDNIIDRDYFETVLPDLADLGHDNPIFYEVKADLTRDELVRLRDAGVKDIQPGIESLHDAVLRLMRKGVNAIDNIELLKRCVEVGVRPHWNILYGFPGEPLEAFTETTALIPHLVHLQPPVAAGPIRLDRFSPNFDEAEALGFRNVRPVAAYEAVYGLDEASLADLAYFFDFDRADDEPRAAAAADLRDAVAHWHARHHDAGLWLLDDGETATVWDFRADQSTSTTFRGSVREVLLLLDRPRSRRELVVATRDIDVIVDDLTAAGLVVSDGRRHLGVAVPLGEGEAMPARFLTKMATDLVAGLR